MIIKPLTTEKTIKLLETENKIVFVVDRRVNKKEIVREIEERFNVKVSKINTQIKNNQKIAFVKLKSETPAIDLATKLGMI